ncbi:MAG: glycosyltransferase family 39 protein [Bacteroidota bacterium]
MNRRWRDALLYAGLALVLLVPRLPGLDSFATADEPYWLSMGANFYYALGQREFENTIYEYQPAVTTMWIVTAAMMLYYPQYRGLGQGYLEFEKGVLDPFLLEHGKDPLVLLRVARTLQVLVIVLLLLVTFWLLRRLVGLAPALAGVMLASLDPFFLGQSRLLDHEALLACFVLISVLALAVYVLREGGFFFVILSGAAAGLAQLTKSSAIALLIPAGLLFLIALYRRRALPSVIQGFGLWAGTLALTYFLFWPGMWVAPGKMLYQVYGNAFSYAFRGARLIAAQNAGAASIGLETNPGGLGQLLYTILWRTTPLTWLGLAAAVVLPFTRARRLITPAMRLVGILLSVTGLGFVALFALAQGRNSPHYTLAAYVMFNLLAGMGWLNLFRWLSTRLDQGWITAAGLGAVLALQAGSAIAFFPYYFTYQNPVLAKLQPRSEPEFAYGEGLELAAKYLAALPRAGDTVALVYYSRGCFSYFFPGQTERFKPYYVEPGHEQDLLIALEGADYLVLYPAVQGDLPKYARLFEALSSVEPVKEIWLNGYRYAVIYQVDAFSLDVYRALFSGSAN